MSEMVQALLHAFVVILEIVIGATVGVAAGCFLFIALLIAIIYWVAKEFTSNSTVER